MIKAYINERKSWIFLFLFTQLVVILVSYIDASIPLTSGFYIVFLNSLLFIIFFVVRYNKETEFYKSIDEWDKTSDLTSIMEAESPFEKIVENSITTQTEQYNKEVATHMQNIEEERDDLTSWIHEVKTPITTIKLMIERIDDRHLKSQLMNEWLRVHLLLDQQLHQKRIPFIKNDLYMEKTKLEELIYTEIKALRSWCMQKGIGFDVSLEVTEVQTDAKWLSFMIRQLLTNAVKYSEESDIMIKSYIANDQIKLQITDSGRGIDPKDISRIFEKGFTSTTKHQDSSATGMGLYLTRKVARSLLMAIEVDSKLGEGTTFTITFPKKNDFVQLTSM
ncbi:sensor histidine kinase [Virgibacillus sp. NKC19-3]|uniref:sensor histidine kinase n=1 Tax=Virgibacillus saliphilus TaxID=2831674 RepID=UPI001C9A77ED|nr:sensor histidine kinase [Virgibacillus sp. NKC19-3]MBY7142091.1 sensor histidine kinase [Virgibacillus sp. NKC19-3]